MDTRGAQGGDHAAMTHDLHVRIFRLTRCTFLWLLPPCLWLFSAGVVFGQSFPMRPVRMVTAEAGGGSDLVSRLLAQSLVGVWGQQVVVDNRGTAGGAIAAEIVAKAPQDGYTLLHYGSNIWLLPFLRKSLPYDPVRDLAPVSLTARAPNIIVVHPAQPIKSVAELIAFAKAKPGSLGYASGGTGSTPHLAAELFKAMAGVDIVRIPYRGGGPALNDLLGGQVPLMFPVAAAALPHVKSGRLRALAVTSAQPTELAPGIPTVAASGLLGYESVSIQGLFAPAGTSPVLINALNRQIVQNLQTPNLKEKFFAMGIESVGSSPDALAATLKSEMVRLGKVIRDAGIHDE